MNQVQLELLGLPALLTVGQIYDSADSTNIATFSEDRRVERKSGGVQPRALGDYFSGWANTVPDGGLVVVGIENDGRVTGCSKLDQSRLNDLERAGEVYCPQAKYRSRRVPVTNADGKEDFVILFRIHYNEKRVVETVQGNAWVRLGESLKKLSAEEIRELQIDKKQVDLELEPSIVPYPTGFDMNLVNQFCEAVRIAGELGSHSNEEILEYRRLGKVHGDKFTPNNACVLLFAIDPLSEFPGCKIRFLRFDGEWEGTGAQYNAVKDYLMEGCVPQLIRDTEVYLTAQLREFSRLGNDGKFYSAPEYPKDAWYEAIVNACVHRSYGLKNMNVFIRMFDESSCD